MKTKDAFAFRSFDAEHILQRPYFRQWRDRHGVPFTDELIDTVALAYCEVKDSEDYDVLTATEKKNCRLNELCNLLETLHKRIMYHANKRLEPYRRAAQKKIADGNCSFQSKVDREQKLVSSYILDVSMAIGDLLVTVKSYWQDSESKLQFLYRQRFGERLKQARKAAGLSRKDLAEACSIKPHALHYYEHGDREPNLITLRRLARYLQVSVDWLFKTK